MRLSKKQINDIHIQVWIEDTGICYEISNPVWYQVWGQISTRVESVVEMQIRDQLAELAK